MRSRAEKLAFCAVLCAMAMILSYIEAMIPFQLIIPLPGFKPGLANVAVMIVFLCMGPLPAAAVSVTRILLSAILFGSVTSLMYSMCGGMLAFGAICIWRYILSKFNGYVGLGVLCAAMHNLGQCLCASIFFGPSVMGMYLPMLLVFSVFTGAFTGVTVAVLTKSRLPDAMNSKSRMI